MPDMAPRRIVEYVYTDPYSQFDDIVYRGKISDRYRKIAILLCVVTGMLGGHYFYLKRYAMGFLFLFTFGFFSIGYWFDILRIALDRFPYEDADGLPLNPEDITIINKKTRYLILAIFFGVLTILFLESGLSGLGAFNGMLTLLFGVLHYEQRGRKNARKR